MIQIRNQITGPNLDYIYIYKAESNFRQIESTSNVKMRVAVLERRWMFIVPF